MQARDLTKVFRYRIIFQVNLFNDGFCFSLWYDMEAMQNKYKQLHFKLKIILAIEQFRQYH